MLEEFARVRARTQILENIELGEEQELQGEILGNHQHFLHSYKPRRRILKSHTVNKVVTT